jgi:8-oxo-dGTP diphosphatase
MKKTGRTPIFAAGGIVVHGGPQPLIAIVQLRKQNDWVLPKGKLTSNEDALAAAKREVLEETGHDVSVHEFLGTMSYDVGSRPKIVQFWRMQAIGGPVRKLMRDVKAVRWLPLDEAVEKLTHSREQVFLASVGPIAIAAAQPSDRESAAAERPARRHRLEPAKPPVQQDLVELAAARSMRDHVGEVAEQPSPTMVGKAWAWLRTRMLGG